MREKLVGRLTWEKIPWGIRVTIPGRPRALAFFYTLLIVTWLIIASVHFSHLLLEPHPEDSDFTLQLIAIGIYTVGFCIFVCWMAVTFTGDTVLSLDVYDMKIQRRALGIELSSRKFQTNHVSYVLYVAPGMSPRRSIFDPNTGKIQFRVGKRMHSFARGIMDTEAYALIVLMMKIYKFPNSYAPIVTDVDS